MVDAHESSTKNLFSKNRWRKAFKEDPVKDPKKPAEEKPNDDADVDDFLKPSTDRAKEQAQREAAAVAFLASSKPRIDVAKAQRWPGASDIVNSATGRGPGTGGLKTGTRKKGLSVSFARTQPDVIGEGGDECEEPSIEVLRRKKSSSVSDVDKVQSQTHRDDSSLGMRTFNGRHSANQEAQRRGDLTRTLTSPREMSPQLGQKMQMGNINTHTNPPPPPPPRGLGQMGLGGPPRPRPLQRAPTGFDVVQDAGAPRPSMDSTYSYDSENTSPVMSKKAPSLAPTAEEEDDFVPKKLQRTATGWSEHDADSDDEPPPPPVPSIPRLPEMNLGADASPLDSGLNHFLQSEPGDPNSFSARLIHKMRSDEGKALHEAARRTADDPNRDSISSADSNQPGSMQSSAFLVGTPPSQSQFTVPLAGKTPPRFGSHEHASPPPSPYAPLNVEDPLRSRARGPSPGRTPLPPGSFPLDTDARPASSSSSQHTMPSGTSRTHGSPTGQQDLFSGTTMRSVPEHPNTHDPKKAPYTVASVQQMSAVHHNEAPESAQSQTSILPTPPQFEKPGYIEPVKDEPPPPPPHVQTPVVQSAVQRSGTLRKPVSETSRRPPPKPAPPSSQPPGSQLARSDTKAQAEIAFSDFSHRVTHMKSIFELTAQLAGSLYDRSPTQWLRAAIWWFVKGRTGMENFIRGKPKSGEPQPERLTQAHVDLAKTWWILTSVVPSHPHLRRYGDERLGTQARAARDAADIAAAELYEILDATLASLKMLLGSMKRHQSMPPTQALIQGQNQSIWEEYPQFAPDVAIVLSGSLTKTAFTGGASQLQFNPANLIPINDTRFDFCYFRMFVTASLSTEDQATDRVPLPVVLSVLRPRDEFQVKLSICSQTELLNLTVSSNPDVGPTWKDVAWKNTRGMNIQLRHGFNLNVDLNEQDFRSLWAVVDHTNRVETNLLERSDERLCTKISLRDVAYKDSTNPGAFPPERVKGCKLMAFEKSERSTEGTGKRRLHRGYRVVVVTSTKTRTLSCVNHEMGTGHEPINFEYTNDPNDNAPGIVLRFKEGTAERPKFCTMTMYFNDAKDRNHLFGTFTSMNQAPEEAVFAQLPFKAFNIESADQAEGFSQSGKDVLRRFKWQEAKVLNQDPDAAGLEAAPTVMSESLRIVCRHGAGVFSDRMNLGKFPAPDSSRHWNV
jgi:hypothetical protein